MKRNLFRYMIISSVVGSLLLTAVPARWYIHPVYASSEGAYVTSSKEIQQKFAEGLSQRKLMISMKYKGSTKNLKQLLQQSINKALESDPYTKYVIEKYVYSWKGTNGSAKISLEVQYRENSEQYAFVNKKTASIVKAMIKPGMNDHQRVKAIHDYVVRLLKYDVDLANYTAYEGLKTGEAVCQGYTLLTYKLLKEAGISGLIAEGTAKGQAHAWNLVKLDGRWYHLDTTWDDPLPDVPNQVRYDYYLRTDEQMRKDHKWTSKYPASTTPYMETLKSMIDKGGDDTEWYQDLEKELGYHLYNPETAAHNVADLKKIVIQGMAEKKSAITVRYSGTNSQLIEDLSQLYELDGVDRVKYLAEPLEGTKDLRVQIEWK